MSVCVTGVPYTWGNKSKGAAFGPAGAAGAAGAGAAGIAAAGAAAGGGRATGAGISAASGIPYKLATAESSTKLRTYTEDPKSPMIIVQTTRARNIILVSCMVHKCSGYTLKNAYSFSNAKSLIERAETNILFHRINLLISQTTMPCKTSISE